MDKQKSWGQINGVIAVTFVMASFFCAFFPALAGTSVVFMVLAIIAGWFAVVNGL